MEIWITIGIIAIIAILTLMHYAIKKMDKADSGVKPSQQFLNRRRQADLQDYLSRRNLDVSPTTNHQKSYSEGWDSCSFDAP